ncbi:MAG: hypothetical protein KIS94_15905 [Chitinophagales bacterium]|nr:hypothetical protein [Chitinophagales bacterium]
MQKLLITATALLLTLAGCKKDTEVLTGKTHKTAQGGISYCGNTQQVDLLAGQTTNIGNVTVGNDENFLYVTYQATGSWYFTELHLFVGDCDSKPVNKAGNPVPGQFPYQTAFASPYSQSYTFVIPLSDLPACYCVAAHAATIKKNAKGGVAQSETAWGNGIRFVPKGNWGMYFNSCKQDCSDCGLPEC